MFTPILAILIMLLLAFGFYYLVLYRFPVFVIKTAIKESKHEPEKKIRKNK